MTNQEFVAWVEKNAARVHSYRNGGDGSDGTCDCIGLIMGAWRMSGNKWPWTHGSNYTARYLVRGLAAGQPLRLGDLVFKAWEPGQSRYKLPSTYRGHHDTRDYYHVGVVTRVEPLEITHCTVGGIKRDTEIGEWTYSGQFNKLEQAVTQDMSTYQAKVYAENGKPVKLRAEASEHCDLYSEIKVGTEVEVIGVNATGWAYVRAGARYGYMKKEFLTDAPQEAFSEPVGGTLYQAVQMAREQLKRAQEALEAAQELLSDAG